MKIKMPSLRKPMYGFAAGVMALAVTVPALVTSKVYAYSQLTARSITMSSATYSASNVTYKLSFKPATTGNVQGIIVDFCDNSPIIGLSTCSAVSGLNIASAGVGNVTGAPAGTWSAADTGTYLTLSNGTPNSLTAGNEVTFELTGITNPSTANHTFYARVLTYTSATPTYSAGSIGSAVDAGGIALSTTNAVSVSGTVQETLTFCVSAAAVTQNDCSDATTPTLELGEGTPKVLGTTTSTGALYSKISTNAANGATIRLKSGNNCGGLMRPGATVCDIAAVGDAATALSGAQFGLRVSATGSDLVPSAPYNNGTNYGMDSTTSGENVTTTYGDAVATSANSSTKVLDGVDVTYTFAAQASNTTPAGVYSANLTLIAVGSY